MTLPENLGQFIYRERLNRGWSQATLASMADVSDRTVSDYERGYRTAHLPTVVALLAALGYVMEIRRIA